MRRPPPGLSDGRRGIHVRSERDAGDRGRGEVRVVGPGRRHVAAFRRIRQGRSSGFVRSALGLGEPDRAEGDVHAPRIARSSRPRGGRSRDREPPPSSSVEVPPMSSRTSPAPVAVMIPEVDDRATHDPATGLPNLSFLATFLPYAIAQAGRRGEPLSLLYIGADRLAAIRELLGEAAAGEAVRTIGRAITRTLRSSDLVARLDDGRLAVVLPGAAAGDARMLAETIPGRGRGRRGGHAEPAHAHRLDRRCDLPGSRRLPRLSSARPPTTRWPTPTPGAATGSPSPRRPQPLSSGGSPNWPCDRSLVAISKVPF